MGLFTLMFHEHSEKSKDLDSKLNELKKVLKKILKGVTEMDGFFWNLESMPPSSKDDAKIIPNLYNHYGKLKKSVEEILKEENEVKSLISHYENEMKIINPLSFDIAKSLIKEFFYNLKMINDIIHFEMQEITTAITLFKEKKINKDHSIKKLHKVFDDYDDKEKKLQRYIKEIYHDVSKLETWGERYLTGPVEERIPR